MKKIVCLIFIGIVFFSSISNVYASMLTIENVSEQFEKSTIIQGLEQLDVIITSKVNTSDKTLDIYTENEKIFSFTYNDEYIEYNNRSAEVTEENCSNNVETVLLAYAVMESVFVLSGHKDKTLSENGNYTNTYDTYGIQLETESYSFSGEDENGSWSMSGDFLKYFKISLNTQKIDALINEYGVDVEEVDPNKEIIATLIPTLEAKNITENSVTIYPKVNYYNTDPDYRVNCYIYRSDSLDGSYEKISEESVNCLDEVGIVNDGLKNNTTYYYKAIVDGGTDFSSPISVTTKTSQTITENNTQDNLETNPNTGFTFPFMITTLLLIASIINLVYIQNRYY